MRRRGWVRKQHYNRMGEKWDTDYRCVFQGQEAKSVKECFGRQTQVTEMVLVTNSLRSSLGKPVARSKLEAKVGWDWGNYSYDSPPVNNTGIFQFDREPESMACSWPFFFLLNFLFIWGAELQGRKKERDEGWEREKERETFCLLVHSSYGCIGQGWARLKSGAKCFIHISYVGGRGSGT